MDFTLIKPGSAREAPPLFKRQFVSAQDRYNNLRVQDNEVTQRLCRECGHLIQGDNLAFQQHVISHEAAFICYQIYHYEKGIPLTKNYYGQGQAKFFKDDVTGAGDSNKSSRDLSRRQMKQVKPKPLPLVGEPRPKRVKKEKKVKEEIMEDDSFIMPMLPAPEIFGEMSFKTEPSVKTEPSSEDMLVDIPTQDDSNQKFFDDLADQFY